MTIRGPLIPLNNGVEMPAIGLGVFQTPPDVTTAAVEEALGSATGTSTRRPRMAMSARSARASAAPGSPATRCSSRRRSGSATTATTTRCTHSTRARGKLGVDQIDLLILHQPLPSAFDRTLGAYRALETLLADGKVRAIGVSNFMPEHLDRLLAETVGRAGREPDRAPPVLPADGAAARCTPSTAS